MRLTFHTTSAVLFLSGAVWAWVHHLDETARAGEALRQFKPWLFKVHGFSAMTFVLLLGMLLTGHVRRGWRARKNQRNGAFFLTSVCLLTLSGYALYYIGGESLRAGARAFHLWLGLATPALLVWHIRSGRKSETRR